LPPASSPQTVGAALEAARRALADHSETPGLDAQTLLAKASGRDRSWILAHPEAQLLPGQIRHFRTSLHRCLSGEALPYVLGEWEFYGRTFQLTQDVLIPRPETELLVETALDFLRHRPGIRLAADVGTGSGCVAVTLLAETADLHVLATDRSLAALRVASQNAIAQKVRSRFHAVEMDLFAGLQRPIDLICANLPYVSTADLDHLPVGRREPRLALDGGPDGLALTGRLLSDLPRCLAPGGRALLEIGAGQGPTLLSYLPEARPRLHAEGMADLAGHDRLMVIDRNAT